MALHGVRIRRVFVAFVSVGIVLTGALTAGTGAGAAPSTPARATAPLLGSTKFAGPDGIGWGHAHPSAIFNGGDPSSYVQPLAWKHWGSAQAYGWGKVAIPNPKGNYYPTPGTIELRAQNLGKCGTRRAYTHLWYRAPSKPGGKLGKWMPWAYHNHTLCTFGF